MEHFRSNLILLTAALIWGCAFIAQSVGMRYIGPWTFDSVRCLIGGATLFAARRTILRGRKAPLDRAALKGGLCCGLVLTFAMYTQQSGIIYTTVGKAGFMTALYVILVPLLAMFTGKKVSGQVWAAACVALAGFWLLSHPENLSLGQGERRMLISAFLFAVHILVIDHFAPSTDGVLMSEIQFFTAGILSFLPMVLLEKPSLASIASAAAPVLYAGILSSGVAYTLQIIGQKDADPTVATLLLSMEAVFAAAAGYVILHEVLSRGELAGCVLVFAAVILAQVPLKRKEKI
ncbi:MAG: DMT family transporter [Solobacterium sp.]|nr:DMT family transporter [Solobacterium sp.]